MQTKISSAEASLLKAIKELEFGELIPDEIVIGNRDVPCTLKPHEARLLHAIAIYGTPVSIKVQDGLPISGIFEYRVRVGKARKMIRFA